MFLVISARSISEPLYHEIIDSVAKRYVKNNKVDPKEAIALASDLKDYWETISKTDKKQKVTPPKIKGKVIRKGNAKVKKLAK